MLQKKIIACAVLALLLSAAVFAQASALRDYVGVIHQTYHPDVVEYLNKIKERASKRGANDAVKAIDNYLKGGFGTGFIVVDTDGTNYILTNNHVISHAYTLSITFEKLDGAKTTYDRLKIVAADEDIDIAILTFDNGAKPFTRALSLASIPAEEGSPVFAAGFPGLGNQAVWSFSSGMISNASVRLTAEPDEEVPEAQLGPYIQHTAPLDPGNSGGPLLTQVQNVTTGYAVAGINTWKARGRENTNFSIPASRVQAYMKSALTAKNDTALRASLDTRLDSFVKGLAVPKAVYPHIAQYLSNACTASNAEFAISEVFERGSRQAQQVVDGIFSYSPLYGMNYAVAWLIEDSLRGKSTGAIRATLGDISKNADGSYTVPLLLSGDRTVNTTWVNEYGIWKLDKAGDLVTGDKSLVAQKEKTQAQKDKLHSEYVLALAVDFAQIFDDRPSVRIGAEVKVNYMLYEMQVFFASDKFVEFSVLMGAIFPIVPKNNTIAILPFVEGGLSIVSREGGGIFDGDYVDKKDSWGAKITKEAYYQQTGIKSSKAFELPFIIKGGVKMMFAAVPGLFVEGAYQFDLFLFREEWVKDNDAHRIMFGIGYAF